MQGPRIMEDRWNPSDVLDMGQFEKCRHRISISGEDNIISESVGLLKDLFVKVAGTSRKALMDGGNDDEGASTEAQRRAITEVLGKDKQNEVLTALYMVRTDDNLQVCQVALLVWKVTVVTNPKTQKMDNLSTSLASPSSERHQIVGHSLGELVKKLKKGVLLVIPKLSKGLKDPDYSIIHCISIGLSEVMASVVRSTLFTFMDKNIPTIRTALGDSMVEPRVSAQIAGAGLYVHLSRILPIFFSTKGNDDHTDVQSLAIEATESVLLLIDDGEIGYLISRLLRGFVILITGPLISYLQDTTRIVCFSVALAVERLNSLSTIVDRPVSNLLSNLQAANNYETMVAHSISRNREQVKQWMIPWQLRINEDDTTKISYFIPSQLLKLRLEDKPGFIGSVLIENTI